jgi:hypothetical protein
MSEKRVVLTMYGKGDEIVDISVTLFEADGHYSNDKNAESYCENINRLNLQNDEWIYAKVIQQNRKVRLKKPVYVQFDVIKKFGRQELGRLYHKLGKDLSVLAIALQDGAMKDTNIYEDLTHHFWQVNVSEEFKKAETASEADITAARQKVVVAINQLISDGEIILNEN